MAPTRACQAYPDGTHVNTSEVIGIGIDAVVIRRNPAVLKIPKRRGLYQLHGSIQFDKTPSELIQSTQFEFSVYTRLEGVAGVARCRRATRNGLLLDYYPNGFLEDYMNGNPPPDDAKKHWWICQLADVVAACHEKHVLIFDIALRNCMLAVDDSIRLIEFTNSSLAPMQEPMSTAVVDGATVKIDLLHLANLIFSIARWEKFSMDCAMENEWPDASQQPVLPGCRYMDVVTRCWNRQYQDARELQRDLNKIASTELKVCAGMRSSAETRLDDGRTLKRS